MVTLSDFPPIPEEPAGLDPRFADLIPKTPLEVEFERLLVKFNAPRLEKTPQEQAFDLVDNLVLITQGVGNAVEAPEDDVPQPVFKIGTIKSVVQDIVRSALTEMIEAGVPRSLLDNTNLELYVARNLYDPGRGVGEGITEIGGPALPALIIFNRHILDRQNRVDRFPDTPTDAMLIGETVRGLADQNRISQEDLRIFENSSSADSAADLDRVTRMIKGIRTNLPEIFNTASGEGTGSFDVAISRVILNETPDEIAAGESIFHIPDEAGERRASLLQAGQLTQFSDAKNTKEALRIKWLIKS